MNTTTDQPADFIYIDSATGYAFHVGQHVYTDTAHGPMRRHTVTKVTATQVELEDERTGEREKYMVKSRVRRGSGDSSYPRVIVGIAREEDQPDYQVGQTVYSHVPHLSGRRPELVTAVTETVITTEYTEAAGQWSGQTRRNHYLVSSGLEFDARFDSEKDRASARRLDAEYAASTEMEEVRHAGSHIGHVERNGLTGSWWAYPVDGESVEREHRRECVDYLVRQWSRKVTRDQLARERQERVDQAPATVPELTPLASRSESSETEAEDLAAFIRRTGSAAPAPVDYPVGVQLASMMELAYLTHGTVLVATRGMHEGNVYRVVRAPGKAPKLVTQRRDGHQQDYDLAEVVEADYSVEHQGLTITWMPSGI